MNGRRSRLGLLLVLLVALTACSLADSDEPVPTVARLDTLPTAIFLTEHAPPAGYQLVNFDPIDARLSERQGWRYLVTGRFEGTFDSTGESANGQLELSVQVDELGEARRVVLRVEGGALSPDDDPRRLEGVRLSNDYYIVDTNGVCSAGGDNASVIADLSAGQIVGGVSQAVPTGHQDEISSVPVWQYTFTPDNVRLPAIHLDEDSFVSIDADLWIAPSLNAVLRYELTVTTRGVRILSGSEPVSGMLTLRYELDVPSLDARPNISIPNGC